MLPAIKEAEPEIKGPFFVTIGDEDKLKIFLEMNPYIPRDQIFVDSYSLAAYKQIGLRNIGDNKEELQSISMKAPTLTSDEWKTYLGAASKLVPIEKGTSAFQIFTDKSKTEGVLRLGATFGVSQGHLIYAFEEALPGDNPVVSEVLKQVISAK